jgi:hypothetical protein
MPEDTNTSESPVPEEPSATIENIGPAQAETILFHNTYNRKVSPRRVTRYAMMMTQSHWIFTGESIILNGHQLLDGSHRLRAIVQSGMTLKLVVVRGVDIEAFKYIDSGASRNLSDSLYITQRPYPRLFAASVNFLAGFLLFNRWTTSGVEIPDRWRTLDEHPEIEDIVPLYAGPLLSSSLKEINRGILVANHVLFHELDPDAALAFSESLVTELDELAEGDPVRAYLVWWQNTRRKLSEHKVVRDVYAKVGNGLRKTWNSVRKGEQVAKFTPPTTAPDII